MTVTVQQNNILTLIVGMFDAAAGASVLASLETILTANDNDYPALAASLSNSDVFKSLYPDSLDSTGFSTLFIDNLVGSEVEDSAKAEAVTWLSAQLDSGASRSTVMLTMIIELYSVGADHPVWGDAYQALVNQSAAAAYFSIETAQNGTDLAALQAAIANTSSDVDSIPALPLPLLLANYTAANTAKHDFLATADDDNDATTSATAADLDADLDAALQAVFEKMDLVIDGEYAVLSPVVQAAILSDQEAVNTELAAYYTSLVSSKAADVDAVAGLTTALATRNLAVAEDESAQQMVVTSNTALLTALLDYGTANNSAVTVNADGSVAGLIEVQANALVLASGISESDNPGIDVLLAAAIAKEAADVVATQSNITAEDAIAVVDDLDLDSAALVALAVLGGQFTATPVAAIATPTSAEISAEITALALLESDAQTALNAYNAASVLATSADTSNVSASDNLVAIIAAFNGVSDVTSADQARVSATVTDAVALAEIALIISEIQTALTVASNAKSHFDTLHSNYATAADVNPIVAALEDAQDKADAATAAITALAALVSEQSSAQTQVDQLATLEENIASALQAFTQLSLSAPLIVDGATSGTEQNDVFVAGTVTGSISDFSALGDDTLYLGTQYTLNSAAEAGANSGSALLELWLTAVNDSTLITLESTPLGANAATAETFEITLTGIANADIDLVEGFITLV